MVHGRHRLSALSLVVVLLFVALPVGAGAQPASPPGATLTVTGFGEASASAETVRLQIAISQGEFFGAPQPLQPGATPGAEERESVRPVLQSLLDAGVAEEDVEIVVSPALQGFFGPGGPSLARLDVTLESADLERVTEVIDAVAVGAAEERLVIIQVGAAYDVADCAPLQREARDAAIADARAQAEVQAELLGVSLGDVVASEDAASDATVGFAPYGFGSSGATCQRPEPAVYPGAPITLPPFDPTAPVEVEVYAAVHLSFAMESGGA